MATAATATIKPGQTILFEGDSLTSRRMGPAHDDWAFARLTNWQRTYADVLAEWAFVARPELNLRFRNSAVGGSPFRQVLERFDRVVPVIKPALVILTTGGNDARRKDPLPEFAANIRTYARKLRAATGGRMLIMGGFGAVPGFDKEGAERAARCRPYEQAARRVMRAEGGDYFDIGPAFGKKARALYEQSSYHLTHSDGSHFSELGSRVIAHLLLQYLGLESLPPVAGARKQPAGKAG
jgi:lysophospholipase L1-like esterase